MQLGAFHTLIADTLKRGTTLNAFIPDATRRAARFIERNYTFQYMRVMTTLDLTQDSFTVSAPARLKSINFWRVPQADGHKHYIRRVDPPVFVLDPNQKGLPVSYFLEGSTTIRLNRAPDQNYSGEAWINQYTDWPTDPAAEPWLLANAEDAMLAQTVLQLKLVGRLAEEMVALAAKDFSDAIHTLIIEEEDRQADNSSMVMNYGEVY